ncbi:hypothetical protein KK473_28025, partial [Klebsiella pneumoniae]|uniref:hypothetical protein n=1 Tax=Klebsiella pneumoniae TaxID=573 RepID=UPI001BE11B96
MSGTVGIANLNDPVQRLAVGGQSSVLAQFRSYPAYTSINYYEYNATSAYHSLQATLSKRTGNLTYFATYTFSKAL